MLVEVDTIDLAQVRRRRWLHCCSVVKHFTVTALAPTVFYVEFLYLQVMKILPGNIFGLILKNKMAARAVFLFLS